MFFADCRRTDLSSDWLCLTSSYFGQSKIQNLGVSALRHKDVGWLDVAVDNALGVRGIECISAAPGNG